MSGSIASPAHSGVRAKSYPCSGSQIPCSQMISMNISPPRLSAARKLASTPAVNARILNSWMRNIGSATCVSMMPNAMSSATPPSDSGSTTGLVQPMVSARYGSIP